MQCSARYVTSTASWRIWIEAVVDPMQRRLDWDVLMHAAVSGDAKSYKTLLEALPGVLRSVTRRGYARFGVEPTDVEDVVQETLLAIHLSGTPGRSEHRSRPG